MRRINDKCKASRSVSPDTPMKGLDRATFESLYQRHGRRAKGFFLRMMGYDEPLADDLTQELFLRVWQHRDTFDPAKPFDTWLYTIAYNLCKNEYRRQTTASDIAGTNEAGNGACDSTPADNLERKELRQQIRQAITRLPEPQREVFILRYEEDLTIAQVAQITGLPEGTVKSRLFTALTTVRNKVKSL